MRLTFTYILKPNKRQDNILKELMWHCSKVYNMLNYDVKEGKEKINPNGILNVESSKIYKKYRKENWHSKYLHSHMLQQIIINYVGDYKSYMAIKEMYETGNKEIKGKPRMPRYKQEEKVQITFTKYAIRREERKIKLSISKNMQEKFQVKSLNFLIPNKLEKLVNLEGIKMIKVAKSKKGKYRLDIIYEKEEKREAEGSNIMAIDLGMNNLATCTNMNLDRSKIILDKSGEIEILNVKLDDEVEKYLKKKGIYPSYHLSKKSWVTIILDDTLKDDEIMDLVNISYINASVKGEWIVPANPKYYDIINAFNDTDTITWKQSNNIAKGDIVYLYVGAPYSSIMYKCEAIETDIPYEFKNKYLSINMVMKIKLLKRYKKGEFDFKRLNECGVNAIRGPRSITAKLSKELNKIDIKG